MIQVIYCCPNPITRLTRSAPAGPRGQSFLEMSVFIVNVIVIVVVVVVIVVIVVVVVVIVVVVVVDRPPRSL